MWSVKDETYAQGSLSEVGLSALSAVKLNKRRDLIVYIEQNLDKSLNDPERRKDSMRSRALTRQHLLTIKRDEGLDNIYIVDGLEEMLELSLILYKRNIAQVEYEESMKNCEAELASFFEK